MTAPRSVSAVARTVAAGTFAALVADVAAAQPAKEPFDEVEWFAGEQLDGARPGATPAERPLRPFAGWLAARGCSFDIDMSFIGRVQEGTVSGMAADGTNFSFPVGPDGAFGGEITIGHRPDGAAIFERVDGRVEDDRLVVDVVYGIAGEPETHCRGDGIALRLGG